MNECGPPPRGGETGRTVGVGIAGSEAAKVLKTGRNIGPSDGDPFGIHDHIAESGSHHCITCIVHIDEIDKMYVIIQRLPATPKLLQGSGAEGRKGSESARAKHAPRLPKNGSQVREPVQNEIRDHQIGRSGGKGQAVRARYERRDPGGPSGGEARKKDAEGGSARYDPRFRKACRQPIAETALRHELDHPPGIEAHRVEAIEEPLGGFCVKPFGGVRSSGTAGALRSFEHGPKKPCFPRKPRRTRIHRAISPCGHLSTDRYRPDSVDSRSAGTFPMLLPRPPGGPRARRPPPARAAFPRRPRILLATPRPHPTRTTASPCRAPPKGPRDGAGVTLGSPRPPESFHELVSNWRASAIADPPILSNSAPRTKQRANSNVHKSIPWRVTILSEPRALFVIY